ncbi:MAG: FAD-dependent oxidoreductase, partial [Clostridia bacterium]|nr:FAD-dependent oxidoreductase [Clostridia bacterium]
MQKYDVAVIGGGFAGVAAAISAAREGAKVILIEKGNCLGGAAAHSLVLPFMKHNTKIEGVNTYLSDGIFSEIKDQLRKCNAFDYGSFLEEELKYILNNMIEQAGVTLLYHAYIYGVNKNGGKIESVDLATKSGPFTVSADYFIDATGDAQVAYLANCPTKLGRESDNLCQPMTLCFRLGNVDRDAFYDSWDELKVLHKKALDNGEFINPRENILVFNTPVKSVLHFNTTRVIKKNPTDPIDVTEAEIIARKQVYEVYDFMKKNAKGLENSFLMMTGAEIGVRESRMIVGDYILTEQECRDCTKFDDAVVACNYDIDIHNPEGSGTSHYFFPEGAYYT